MRIIFIVVCLFFQTVLTAQVFDSTTSLILKKDLGKALKYTDNQISINPNNAEAYLSKALVYNSLSRDPGYKDMFRDANAESFINIQTAFNKDKKLTNKIISNSNYNLIFDIYKSYSNQGVAFFNSGINQKNKAAFGEALSSFLKAGEVSTYIFTHNWGLSAIDSSNLFNVSKSAINADNESIAILYSKKIADNNIIHCKEQKSFEDIYRWLVFYYKTKNDITSLNKYTGLAIAGFPESEYFDLNMIDWLRDQTDYPGILLRYDAMNKRGINREKYIFSYLTDLFTYLSVCDDRIKYELQNRFEDEMERYVAQNPENQEANLLFGKFYINRAADLQNKFRFQPDLSAKKLKILKKTITGYLTQSNDYLQKILADQTNEDRGIYQEAKDLIHLNKEFLERYNSSNSHNKGYK